MKEVIVDNNTMIVLVTLLFIVLIIIGFLLFRRKTKVGIELPGGKLNFEGSNEPSVEKSKVSKGILRNLSLGKTRMEIKGTGAIADNISVGDTELRVAETGSKSKKTVKQRRKY
jgi:hypothetical protein